MANIKKTTSIAPTTAPVMPMMPMLPDILANAMPVQVPQMEWSSGAVQDFFHNWKLKRIERSSEREANIAVSKTRLVKTTLDMMKSIMTFGAETQLAFKNYEHQAKMMESEQITAALRNQYFQSEIQLKQVHVQIANAELEKLTMENNVAKKNMEKLLNDPED